MPCYPYRCECGNDFEVVKSMSEIDRVERCSLCQRKATRQIGLTNFTGASEWNSSAYRGYNPAFGKVVNGKTHQRELLAQARGEGREMIEIGNEKPETIEKNFKKERETKRAKRWAEV